MLHGPLAHQGYDWWWHSFTAQDAETGEDKPFFIEFFMEDDDIINIDVLVYKNSCNNQ